MADLDEIELGGGGLCDRWASECSVAARVCDGQLLAVAE